VIFPVIYAVLTWYCAGIWRRRWLGFAAVGTSAAVLLSLARMLAAWSEHIPWSYRMGLVLFWPYVALVVGIGLYIALLPRRPGAGDCQRCRYALTGLDPVDLACPECGEPFRGPGSGHEPRIELTPVPRLSRQERLAVLSRRRAI